ncbi:MAG: hypothetical protein HZA54_13660 [Planctomycetes bacterium]|nr:hypothetical protein [Planctomycetota bacterium]
MIKRRSAGIGMIAVIILACVASVLVLLSYFVYEDLERTRSVNKRLETQIEAMDKQKKEVDDAARDLMKLVGFTLGTQLDDKSVDELVGQAKSKTQPYGVVGETYGMEEALLRAQDKASHLESRALWAESEKTQAKGSAAAAKKRMDDVRAIKEQEIQRLRQKLDDLNKQLADEGAAYAQRVNSLNTQSRQLDDDIAALERKQADEKMRKQNELNKARADLDELLKKEAIVRDFTETQGEIVDSDTRREYSIINLGDQNRILPGLKFRVFRKDKGGRKRWKGEVEVKQVFEDHSKCSITQLADAGDPLVHGDFITNPLYGAQHPKRIALVGQVSGKNSLYTMDELKRRILTTGAVIEDTVTIHTDYVLRGADAEEDPNFKIAVNLSVPMMPVEEILPYIGD